MKDDFENAKEEIRALKMEAKQLNYELSLAKREAMRVESKGPFDEVSCKYIQCMPDFHDKYNY